MVIVSQDKEAIVNFENVILIEVDTTNNSITFYSNENRGRLGKYKNYERAKEVLQEIVELGTRQRGVVKIEKLLSLEARKIIDNIYKEKFDIVDYGLDFIPYGNVVEKYEMPEE